MNFIHLVKRQRRNIAFRVALLFLIACAAFSVNLLLPKQAEAACDSTRPCASVTTIYFGYVTVVWSYAGGSVDFWQIIYYDEGTYQGQIKIDNSSAIDSAGSYQFNLNSLTPGDYYGFQVEACQNEFLAPANCTAWSDVTYYAPSGPDTCLVGYVWREAWSPADHVCVTPATRDQAAYDNSQAPYRVNPNGGPYGPNTCLDGYVWRQAISTDYVCVTPATYDQTASDNSMADSRKLFP